MSPSTTERLRPIQQEIDFLTQTCHGRSQDDVLGERAVVRSLEVIGEATKALPDDFREAHSEIDGRRVAGMRDRLIHGYFTVNLDTVWNVVTVHIPQLALVVQTALTSKVDESKPS